jgi:hypothetical protein
VTKAQIIPHFNQSRTSLRAPSARYSSSYCRCSWQCRRRHWIWEGGFREGEEKWGFGGICTDFFLPGKEIWAPSLAVKQPLGWRADHKIHVCLGGIILQSVCSANRGGQVLVPQAALVQLDSIVLLRFTSLCPSDPLGSSSRVMLLLLPRPLFVSLTRCLVSDFLFL